jgi:hypothetical protein
MSDSTERLCPSAKCEEGAVLLGIIGPQGSLAYINPRVEVDASFVDEAKQGRAPEKRFRFAQPCMEGKCHYWTGSSCGVVSGVLAEISNVETEMGLPRCSIRKDCRWFAQEGPKACYVCPLVVTDLNATDDVLGNVMNEVDGVDKQ